jgi:hypothetical protein
MMVVVVDLLEFFSDTSAAADPVYLSASSIGITIISETVIGRAVPYHVAASAR